MAFDESPEALLKRLNLTLARTRHTLAKSA
jgi:hypothetical protein